MQDFYGMPFQKAGPVHRPYVKIKDLWDSLVPYIDYDGVMFAVNDSTEKKFNDSAYEMAYAVYGDPRYASIIKLQTKPRSALRRARPARRHPAPGRRLGRVRQRRRGHAAFPGRRSGPARDVSRPR